MISENTSPKHVAKERKPPRDPRVENEPETPEQEQEQALHPLESEGPELFRDSHT